MRRRSAGVLALVATRVLSGCGTHPLDAVGLAPMTLRDGLLAHYTFDEGSGTTLFDHSGNRHDGVLTGGTWIADGAFGGALHLAGTDYVSVNGFPDAPSSMSVSGWVRTTAGTLDAFETVLSTEIVFIGGWELNVITRDAGLSAHFAYWDVDAQTYSHFECPCLKENRWMHVASVVDGSSHTLSAYIDGALAGVVPTERAILPGSPTLYVGRWSGAQRFLVGDIDDVSIYSRALAPAEIVELGKHPPSDPP